MRHANVLLMQSVYVLHLFKWECPGMMDILDSTVNVEAWHMNSSRSCKGGKMANSASLPLILRIVMDQGDVMDRVWSTLDIYNRDGSPFVTLSSDGIGERRQGLEPQ